MRKAKRNEQFHSPSVTPQSTKSKQVITKKKPPSYTKTKHQQVDKSIKVRQKSKKNRTNSATPKTLKGSIYDQAFHSSNLSDPDITSKLIEVSRPTSKISKPRVNRLETPQKIKELKKPASFITQVTRKPLNRVKKLKQGQEKENRKSETKKETKKPEINNQNQQVRLESSLKYKKIKKKSKKTESKIRSESSSKVRNYSSIFIEPARKNKRSVSIGEYCFGYERRSESAILDYIKEKNNKKTQEKNFEILHQRAAEISKAERLNKLDVFTKSQRRKSPKVRRAASKSFSESEDFENPEVIVERNISFIEENSSVESLSQEKITTSDYDNLKEARSGIIEVYSEDSLGDPRIGAALVIQRFYRKYLLSKLLKKKTCLNISYSDPVRVFPVRKTCSVQAASKISIKPEKLKKILSTVQSKSFLIPKPIKVLKFASQISVKIEPNQKFHLKISRQDSIKLSPHAKPGSNLMSRQSSFNIFPVKQSDSASLHDQLKEQIAWNSAQVYIIEQLRSEEISTLSSVIKDSKKRAEIIQKIQDKYQALLSVLKGATEFRQSDYLENLSLEEYSKFEKNKQNKQALLYKALAENEETLSKGFSLNLNIVESADQGVQLSSDLSSDETEIRSGISHSLSLSKLHGDGSAGKYFSPSQSKETSTSKIQIFFDEPIEVQSVSLLSRESVLSPQIMPSLNLEYMQKQVECTEPRILTNTDSVLEYTKTVMEKLDFCQILADLKKPVEKDLEKELLKLQEKVVGTPSETKIYDFPLILNYFEIISDRESSKELDTTFRQISQADKIHKKMLIEVLNLQFQQFRPNGFEGKPVSWSSKSMSFPKCLSAEKVKEKVLKDIETFSYFQIGKIFNEETITSNKELDESFIQSLRADSLDRLIYFDTLEEERNWTDYEFEETQVKFDVSDMVLEVLIEELEKNLGD